jgi:hypothetical protein
MHYAAAIQGRRRSALHEVEAARILEHDGMDGARTRSCDDSLDELTRRLFGEWHVWF